MISIKQQVDEWNKRMNSLPDFDEIRDVEFIRRSGRINMIMQDLVGELCRRGRYAGASWVLRCRENHIAWPVMWDIALKDAIEKHGPAHTWFTDDLINEWEEDELAKEQIALEKRLLDLKNRRAKQK